mgnify:CR=1 FL=1
MDVSAPCPETAEGPSLRPALRSREGFGGRSIWMKERLSGVTKFVTLVPNKGKTLYEV